jgi:hypothetical protein
MSQHKASLRRSIRSALKHKGVADKLIDSLADVQNKLNAAIDKLAADNPASLDTNYAATQGIAAPFKADDKVAGQSKTSTRSKLRSTMKHKRAADAVADAMEQLQARHNAMLAKLDAEAGTLDDTNYASTLGVSVMNPSAATLGQNKASLRKIMRSAMSHQRLADQIVDGIIATQSALNAVLAQLDTSVLTGIAAKKIASPIKPDQA